MIYKNSVSFKLLLLMSLFVAGCKSACQKDALKTVQNSEQGSGIAAFVNGVGIDSKELDLLHKRAVEQFSHAGRQVSSKVDRDLRGSILRKMIDDELFKQQAQKENVQVDRIERVEGLEKYKEKMGGPQGFELFLKQQNLTEDQVMQTVLADLQREKLINKESQISEPTEEEIKKNYESNLRFYTLPEMVRVRHILLKLAPNEPKEKADLVLAKANQILKEAQAGGSFEALVQKYSESPGGKHGGDVGFFGRGQMAKPFEDAAFNAPLKTPVGPVRTDMGYHIMYVEEKNPSKPAELEQVRPRIVEYIKRGKRSLASEDLLKAWRKEAKITINDYSMTYEEYVKLSNRTDTEKGKKADANS